jgi:hypothetical protein
MNIDSNNLPSWSGPVGVKSDGGGSIRGQGRVGSMRMHRAVHNKRLDGEWLSVFSLAVKVRCSSRACEAGVS